MLKRKPKVFDVFKWYRKRPVAWNGLTPVLLDLILSAPQLVNTIFPSTIIYQRVYHGYTKRQVAWQCCIQMYFGTAWTLWAPKNVLVTLFPYIFDVKTKWNTVYKYLKNIYIYFHETNILLKMHWTSNIFGPSATSVSCFRVSLNYPILQENGMLKKRLDAALHELDLDIG